MGGERCQRCAALERDLDRLGHDLQEAEEKIEQLEQVIEQVASLCLAVLSRAEPILSRRGGVARGFWSRVKGRVDVAELVLKVLG